MFIELWDSMDTVALNILMDHPLRFHPTMQKHPRNYLQFCCDDNHVDYVKKYFGGTVGRVEFMPHAGTYNGKLNLEVMINVHMMCYFLGHITDHRAIWNRLIIHLKIMNCLGYFITILLGI